jgi:hypothetical protein
MGNVLRMLTGLQLQSKIEVSENMIVRINSGDEGASYFIQVTTERGR